MFITIYSIFSAPLQVCLFVKMPSFPFVLHQPLGGVEGHILASLAPPVYLSEDRLGWTLLVCMVSDFRRGHLEISWSSTSEGLVSISPYSKSANAKHRGHNAVSVITVATSDWPSYRCSVSHRRHAKITKRRHSTMSGRPVDDIA